jgi:hypothetical protein
VTSTATRELQPSNVASGCDAESAHGVVYLRAGICARELRKHVTILEREIAVAKAHAVRLGRTVAHPLIDFDGIDDAAHLFARPGLLVLARAGTNDEHQFSPRHDPEF